MHVIKSLLNDIYGDQAEELLSKLQEELGTIESGSQFKSLDDCWYKDIILYVTYPDSFCNNKKCDLNTLTSQVEHIKNLGCNAIHVLPFFKSPMIDMGFDVSDYLNVRDNVGGNKAFEKFLDECSKKDIRVFVDIVLNHVSFKHEWFQKALEGDQKYQNFFIMEKNKPEHTKTYVEDGKTMAQYRFGNNIFDVFLIFPDQAGEVPHWEQYEDGNWYYHTFYPHQIDVDWHNPQVFIEFSKILAYWAKKGVSFRLDAIPFIGKNIKEGVYEDDDMTQKIVQALHEVVKSSNPDSVFLAEGAFELDKIKKYFGTEDIVESELAYNFALNANLWISVLNENPDYIWAVLNKTFEDVPEWASWVNFVRNHDALMVDRLAEKIDNHTDPDPISKMLEGKGLNFAGDVDISGRTFSFLEEDVERHLMIYFLLASMPGCPAIIYGDEVGKVNDFEYMKEMVDKKKEELKNEVVVVDARDISRGHVDINVIDKSKVASRIYSELSRIFNKRLEFSDDFNCDDFERIEFEDDELNQKVFAGRFGEITVLTNLTENVVEIPVKGEVVLQINNIGVTSDCIELGRYGGVWVR